MYCADQAYMRLWGFNMMIPYNGFKGNIKVYTQKMQLDLGNEPTLRCAYVTSMNVHFGKV